MDQKEKNPPSGGLTKLAVNLLSCLSLTSHYFLGSFIGGITFLFNNRSKHIADTNLSICFPRLSKNKHNKLLKVSLKENAKTLIEAFWLWKHSQEAIGDLLNNIENEELLVRAKQESTIFVTPHFGSWEYIGLLTATKCDLLILYAPPKSKYIEEQSCIGRSASGGKVISTDSLNLKQLIRHLKNGGSVGILPDQVPAGNGGVYSPFFNRQAYTGTLVCKLANKLKCHVVFCYALRTNSKSTQFNAYYYEAPDDIFSDNLNIATDCLNKCIEDYVIKSPEQYIWGYKRFKNPAPGDTNPY